jgi:hypothetical protein
MNINEALQDVQTIKIVAAGLTRKRDDIYLLMMTIYQVGLKWLKPRMSAELRDAIADHEKIRHDHRTNKNIFRFLVEVASPLDIQQRSRYTNVLRYAWLRHCPLEGLTEFIKRNGGIEECAKKYIAHKKKVRFKRTTW